MTKDIQDAFFEAQRNHSIYGQQILEKFGLKGFIDYALKHHKNIDGSGYPAVGAYGSQVLLDKKEIQIQILKIIDGYNALREPRIYKPPKGPEEIEKILSEMPKNTKIVNDKEISKPQEITEELHTLIDQIVFILSLSD